MKIVILGGGFGGLRVARKVAKGESEKTKIILVDKNKYQVYTPSLYEVATAYRGDILKKDSLVEKNFQNLINKVIAFPFSDVFSGGGSKFVQGEVLRIDPEARKVIVKKGGDIKFDILVVALGSETNYFGVEGASRWCLPIKTLDDALCIRENIRDGFARCKKDGSSITIAVIGAGLSGFEIATETAVFVSHLKKRHRVKDKKVKIILLEASHTILPGSAEPAIKKAQKRLSVLGVNAIVNACIVKTNKKELFLKGGDKIEADVKIWSCGTRASSALKGLRPLSKRGQVIANQYLLAEGRENIFVLGDCVDYIREGTWERAPQTAWAAEQEADTVAYNILAKIEGREMRGHKVNFLGAVSSAGGKYGVAHLWGRTYAGFFVWVLKNLIVLKYLLSIYGFFKALSIWAKSIVIFGRND